MTANRIVAVTRPDLPGDGMARLGETEGIDLVIRESHEPTSPDELRQLIAGARAVIATGMDRFDATVLRSAKDLRILATTSVGVDHIDLADASELGIAVTNTPGALEETCADYTFGLLLAARRRIVETDGAVRRGAWRRHTMHEWLGADVHGSRLGLVGFGSIARAVATRAIGFSMEVVHHDRSRTTSPLSRWVPLADLLSTSDIVSLHVPLNSSTHHLIDDRALGLMKATASLINTARGAVVDSDALVRALRERRLHSAALDVVEGEPVDDIEHPILGVDHLVIAPHAASATLQARAAMVDRAVDNVLAVLGGQPPIDPVGQWTQ